jgi:hypothetical protein
MSNIRLYAATAVFVLIVLVSGILHGVQTFRWTDKPSLDSYVARLRDIPTQFDDWSNEIGNLSPEQLIRRGTEVIADPVTGRSEMRYLDNLKAHGIEDYILRDYRNRRSTETYTVLVVCGRPGPIASHTPDVCYRGSGYSQVGEQTRGDITIDDENSQERGKRYPLNLLQFRPPITRLDARELQIRWAWMAPGELLKTPSNPRYDFAMKPALFKVYIHHELAVTASSSALQSPVKNDTPLPNVVTTTRQDPSVFLKAFLPRLEQALKGVPAP